MVELEGILGWDFLGGQGSILKDGIGSPEVVTMIVFITVRTGDIEKWNRIFRE